MQKTAVLFSNLGGQVTKKIYSNMDHTVNEDELAQARALIAGVIG